MSLIQAWLNEHQVFYHSVDFHHEDFPETFSDGPGVFEWSVSHFNHLINLKESALSAAKKMWADYLLVIFAVFTYNLYIF